MAKTFKVGIYSPEQTIYSGEVVSLIAPSVEGYLGILAEHAPLAVKLSSGKITLRFPSGDIRVIDVSGPGFLEVARNQATLLL